MRALWTRWSLPSSPRGRTDDEHEYYALSEGVYSRFARAYDIFVRPAKSFRRHVVRLSRASADASVIDVATGTGEQARAFAERCRQVVGVDLSENMLRVARAKTPMPGLTYVRADATELPYDDNTFDVATISFALHEMPATVRGRVLDELMRVTKPTGVVVVVDWGLPRGSLASEVVYRLVRFFEDARYAEFVRLDLPGLLARTGMQVVDDRRALLGAARVVVGFKSKCDDYAR